MLVLTRCVREKVFVHHKGETLEIVVTDIHAKEVKLAFGGSANFVIHRDDMIKKKEVDGNV